MARAENVQTISGQAGEVLPIYRFVQLQSDGQYDLMTGASGTLAHAVTAEAAAAAGDTLALCPAGQPCIMLVEAAEAIAVGDMVAAETATGKAIGAVTAGAGLFNQGVAQSASSADGEIIEVLLLVAANQV